jgi:hypothetical protein
LLEACDEPVPLAELSSDLSDESPALRSHPARGDVSEADGPAASAPAHIIPDNLELAPESKVNPGHG